MVDAYEQLRHYAIERGTTCGLRGLAILIRKGVGAWMQACNFAVSQQQVVPSSESRCNVAMPAGVQREIVEVLATMALTTTLQEAAR